MANWSGLQQWLNDKFKGSKEIGDAVKELGFGLAGIGLPVSLATANPAPLGVALVVAGAGQAVKGTATILAGLTDPGTGKEEHDFQQGFYLLCLAAYAKAIKSNAAALAKKSEKTAQRLKIAGNQAQDELLHGGGAGAIYAGTHYAFELDLERSAGKLFDAFDAILSRRLGDEGQNAVRKVRSDGLANLDRALCETQNGFLYRFAQRALLKMVSHKIDSLPEKVAGILEPALSGFLRNQQTEAVDEAWQNYRRELKDQATRPILGMEALKQDGGGVSICDIFVWPQFTVRPGSAEGHSQGAAATPEENVAAQLALLITRRNTDNSPVFLFGEAGSGKTCLLQMLAAALANCPNVNPVFVPLQKINPGKDLAPEIDEYLRAQTSLGDEGTRKLASLPNLVFILDAFDELAYATRSSLCTWFPKVRQLNRMGKYMHAAVIVSGRNTLFTAEEDVVPPGCSVLTLQPFTKEHIAAWSAKWSAAVGQNFDGTAFLKEPAGGGGGLGELATLPLTLSMLARLAYERLLDGEQQATASVVYRKMIQWACDRQQQEKGTGSGSVTGRQMRQLLQILGFCSYIYSRRSVDIQELERAAREVNIDIPQKPEECFSAQRAILAAMRLQVRGQRDQITSFEWVHRSFGEYLAAEYIADRIDALADRKKNAYGEEEWSKNPGEAATVWAGLFSRALLTPEIEEFLSPMLGRYGAFFGGKDAAPETARLANLMSRAKDLVKRFHREEDWLKLGQEARAAELRPSQALANCLLAALCVGNRCARLLSTPSVPVHFELHEPSWGFWLDLSHTTKCFGMGSPDKDARFLDRVRVDSCIGPGRGLYLPHVRWEPQPAAPTALQDQSEPLVDLAGATLTKADLSGADLTRVDLAGADLAGATLSGARLSHLASGFSSFADALRGSARLAGAEVILRGARRPGDQQGQPDTGKSVAQLPRWSIYAGWPLAAPQASCQQTETAQQLGKPSELTLELGHNMRMEVVLLPAGRFLMGSPGTEQGRSKDETQHEVTISQPFYMGKYEVTQEQYEAVMDESPACFPGPKNPVEQVSWDDAREFCRRLSANTGKTILLPTEAQWEYACRAGTETPFNTGATISTQQANYDGNYTYGDGAKGEYRKKPVAVGSFSANAFGLYDMHGNVWEWCEDWYGEYPAGAATDPKGPADGAGRVVRGGSWGGFPWFCRSAYRDGDSPGYRYYYLGFRVVAGPSSRTP